MRKNSKTHYFILILNVFKIVSLNMSKSLWENIGIFAKLLHLEVPGISGGWVDLLLLITVVLSVCNVCGLSFDLINLKNQINSKAF